MSLRNTENSYGRLAILLHWLMALMVIGMIAAGYILDAIGKGATKDFIAMMHVSTGVVVLLLALFRWYWSISSKAPKPLEGVTKAETGMAHATKWLLMIAMLGMPLSGFFMVMLHGHGVSIYGLFEVPALLSENKDIGWLFGKAHGLGGYAISAIIGLHILGAIKHHFINKDNTLNRMLGK